MRPKITTCKHIARSIAYNEQKVEQHVAERLTAANLLKPLPRLSQDDILHRFQRRMELNDRVRTSLHITLNFDPQDKLTNDKMLQIAHIYMKEIGFERQPWMAWRHNDAGHPHCHIVATHVKADGDPIDLYNIGKNQSEQARTKIETEFNLTTAEIKRQQREQQRKDADPSYALRLTYGEETLSRALSRIVEYVTQNYHYTTLQELNAVLRLYNVEAYSGRPGTKLYQDRGLLYRALDENGHYIGRPLKASFFDCKPTLNNLEKRFAQNLSFKEENKEWLEVYVNFALNDKPDDFEKIRDYLCQGHILMVVNQDRAGIVRQVSYIDTKSKLVVNGEELPGVCHAQSIQELLERQKVRIAFEQTQQLSERKTQHRSHRL